MRWHQLIFTQIAATKKIEKHKNQKQAQIMKDKKITAHISDNTRTAFIEMDNEQNLTSSKLIRNVTE